MAEANKAIFAAIKKRRSIREFTSDPVSAQMLREIITAGIWAPSGLNNQPWRFVIVIDPDCRKKLAQQTHYGHIVAAAPALIAVYIDKREVYDITKDCQSAGACIQNMLLVTEELGLGAVWLGQILKNKDKVNVILDIADNYELMAVLAIGHPRHRHQQSTRKSLAEFIIKEIGGN